MQLSEGRAHGAGGPLVQVRQGDAHAAGGIKNVEPWHRHLPWVQREPHRVSRAKIGAWELLVHRPFDALPSPAGMMDPPVAGKLPSVDAADRRAEHLFNSKRRVVLNRGAELHVVLADNDAHPERDVEGPFIRGETGPFERRLGAVGTDIHPTEPLLGPLHVVAAPVRKREQEPKVFAESALADQIDIEAAVANSDEVAVLMAEFDLHLAIAQRDRYPPYAPPSDIRSRSAPFRENRTMPRPRHTLGPLARGRRGRDGFNPLALAIHLCARAALITTPRMKYLRRAKKNTIGTITPIAAPAINWPYG